MDQKQANEIRQQVQKSYTQVAEADNNSTCYGNESSCCGVSDDNTINTLISTRLGYSQTDLDTIPDGADMGLGCGNPCAIASIMKGETVLDLGSGGGLDCFLAAAETGEKGHVIGIDMTSTMISKARSNAVKGNYTNVEFRLGEIEHIPAANNTVDIIISNCVINLSPEKKQVFAEAIRVLKPGGRLAISDVVAGMKLPEEIKNDRTLYSGCIAGASEVSELQAILKDVGFEQININPKDESKTFIKDWAPGRSVEDYVLSATIEAVKPLGVCC